MTFPKQVRAGDYVQWRIPADQDVFGNSISSPDWSVIYYLRTNTSSEGAIVNSSAYLDGFEFNIASTTTASFDAGDWFYQAVANKSGAEKQTIYTGQIEVLESLEDSRTAIKYDGRWQEEEHVARMQTATRKINKGTAVKEQKTCNTSTQEVSSRATPQLQR